MKILIVLAFILLFQCCDNSANHSIRASAIDTITKYLPDSSKGFGGRRDYDSYLYKNRLTEMLSLNRLELGTDSFELRFWSVGALTDPIILYILKKPVNGEWTNLHYQIYRGESWNDEQNPRIDSLLAESVKPGEVSWLTYISNLHLDSLWNTPSQYEVVDDRFGAVDGYSFYIELADRGRYRFMNYYVPDHKKGKEINHTRVFTFQENLRSGILYKGIINP